MNVLGIIAEYNPFHNGHAYHLEQARQKCNADGVICVMSGNFMQRGDAAIADKWTRATLAAKAGIDLVIELPTVFAVRSAENFADGGIKLLNNLGIVTHVAFGAETANLVLLKRIAATITSPEFSTALRNNLKNGLSYPAALSHTVKLLLNDDTNLLREPNNILAIEYLKALHNINSLIRPIAIPRHYADHHDINLHQKIASATAIRNALHFHSAESIHNLQTVLPAASFASMTMLQKIGLADMKYLDTALLAKLRCLSPTDLAQITGISEGLENKIIAAALHSTTIADLKHNIKSKRYPMSRLKRILLHCLLGCTQEQIRQFDQVGPLYCRVLAFTEQGRVLLKQIKTNSTLPIITKTTQYISSQYRHNSPTLLSKMLAYDTYATDLYALCFAINRAGGQDFTQSPIYVQ